jgi:aspartate 1-decarboxylase
MQSLLSSSDSGEKRKKFMSSIQRTFLKSKIHRATVTEANTEYEGSITVDPLLLELADILPFERVEVYNISNGCRFATYVIEGVRGEGALCVNGAAARLVSVGDKVIVCSYATLPEKEIPLLKQRLIFVDAQNRPKSLNSPSVRAGEEPEQIEAF